MFRTLSTVIALALISGPAFAAPKEGREKEQPKPREEQLKDRNTTHAADLSRNAYAVSRRAADFSPTFNRTTELAKAMSSNPYDVQVENTANNSSKALRLSVNEMVNGLISNLEGSARADQVELAKEGLMFASFFGRQHAATEKEIIAKGAAYRQLETIANMTKPGYKETEEGAIASQLRFVKVANQLANDNMEIGEIMNKAYAADRKTSDQAAIEKAMKDQKNCE